MASLTGHSRTNNASNGIFRPKIVKDIYIITLLFVQSTAKPLASRAKLNRLQTRALSAS
jgi:hypothetical protein